jgi:hypothetical protein
MSIEHGRITLKWILKKYGVDSSSSRQCPMVVSREDDNELLGSTKGEKFLDR